MVELGDHSEVNEENYVPVPEEKLKEDQKKEYEELVEKFKRECLKYYNVTRSGDVIKKFNIPSLQPLTEVQRDNKMMDAVGQAVAQAFIKSSTVMGNTVHNAVVKTFVEGMFPDCMGPCYIQPDQMQYIRWKYLWQRLCRLQIARQKQVTAKRRHRLLLRCPQS